MGKGMRRKMMAIAAILGCRDFAGVATSSLVSIYLQKAHGFDARHTGWVVGAMMLSSAWSPIRVAVWLSPGKKRLPALMINLLIGGVLLVMVPRISVAYVLAMLAIFQVFHLGSYAIGEAAMLERVHPEVRGRVIGCLSDLRRDRSHRSRRG
jgi:MFS family permease